MLFLSILGLILIKNTHSLELFHPNTFLNTSQLIEKYNYPFENHEVVTEDGYILGTHRIPHGLNNTNSTRIPVLLMHGFTGVSTYWLTAGAEKGIGFILADAGYDVWLANQRGNVYSLKHKTIPASDTAKFFNFSMHEVGVYDLPALVDYILNITGQESVYYIGHSQGTNDLFIFLAEKPEYNDKVRLAIHFGPTVYVKNIISPLPRIFASIYDIVNKITNLLKIHRFFPKSLLVQLPGDLFCNNLSPLQKFCPVIIFLLTGFDFPQLDPTLVTAIGSSQPAGSSMLTFKQYLQHINSGVFQQYDWGTEGNLAQYGQETPPEYNLTAVTCPIALHYSPGDWMAVKYNVEHLIPRVVNLAFAVLSNYSKFNHADFLWATDVKNLLYNQVLEEMEVYK